MGWCIQGNKTPFWGLVKKYKKAQKEFNKILEEVKARKAAEKAEKEESKRNVHFTPGSKSVYKNFSIPRRLIITT